MKIRPFYLAALLGGMLILGTVSASDAAVWTDVVDLDQWLSGKNRLSWEHALPTGSGIPDFDRINSATLEIYATQADRDDDRHGNGHHARRGDRHNDTIIKILVEGKKDGTGEFSWYIDGLVFVVKPTFESRDVMNQLLDVELSFKGYCGDRDRLWLDRSRLTLEYTSDPGTHPTGTPVPEPATMVLFGSGCLLGLAYHRRGGR